MALSTELQRLAELKASGVLSESEFQRAKEKLLNEDSAPPQRFEQENDDNSLGRAANRYVSYQLIFSIIGIIIFLIFASSMCSRSSSQFGPGFPSPLSR